MVQRPTSLQQQPPQRQQPIGYPQYIDTAAAFKKSMRNVLKMIAVAVIVLGIIGMVWGTFGTPQSKVSPGIGLLGPDESRLVTLICSPCDISAAKSVVGNDDYIGAPAQDRLVVRATGAQISQFEDLGWVQYISE